MLDKSKGFFEYLLAISNLKYKPIRIYNEYEKTWQDDLLEELREGCYMFGDGKDNEAILELHRQELTKKDLIAPEPPTELKEWIDFNYKSEFSQLKIPANKIYISDKGEQIEERFQEDRNRLVAFQSWKDEWEDWAEYLKEKKKTKRVYEEFFNLIQTLQKEGESLELLFGKWIFTWKHKNPNIGEIKHPLFSLKLDLHFDADTGIIKAFSSYQCFRLEKDMLGGINLPNAQKITEISQQVMFLDFEDNIDNHAVQFVKLIDASGRVSKDLGKVEVNEEPAVYDKYMFFVRRKDNHVIKKDLETIIEGMNNDDISVTPSIASIVGDEVSVSDNESSNGELSSWEKLGEDLYFPLPSNEEQKEIIRRLSNNFGITVQGPPGTGKTHSIANIVSHLLAHGKKVLITSQKESPLKVLKNKIPQEIQDLCVPVLGGGRESLREIEKSIRTISEKLGTLSPEKLEDEIIKAKEELDKSKRKEAELKNRLMEFTKSEKGEITFKGHVIDKTDVAKMLNKNTLDLSWIKDKIVYPATFPLNDDEFVKLWSLKKRLSKEELKLKNRFLPPLNKIKRTTELLEWLEEGERLKSKKIDGEKIAKEINAPSDAEYLSSIASSIDEILLRRFLLQKENPMIYVVDDCIGEGITKERWFTFIETLKEKLKEYVELNQKVVSHVITLPEKKLNELEEEVGILRNHLEAGKKLNFLFFLSKGKKTKYLCETNILNGNPISKLDDVKILNDYIEATKRKEELVRIWNGNVAEINAEQIDTTESRFVRELDKRIEDFNDAFALSEMILQLIKRMDKLTIQQPKWTDESFYEKVQTSIQAALNVFRYKTWQQEFEVYLSELKGIEKAENSHPIVKEFLNALQYKKVEKWDDNIEVLSNLIKTKEEVHEFYSLVNKLGKDLPFTAKWIEEHVASLDEIPNEHTKAWEIQTLANWMMQNDNFDYKILEKSIQNEQNYQKRLINDIVSKSTWKNQIERITEPQKRALVAWKNFITRYGKGTGKNAKYLTDARREMGVAQGAIPVWIMPVNNVIENFPVTNEQFDVIIFDESSQCDIMSIPVLMRGKKIVVVGDDEQISPYGIGVKDEDIEELVRRYLDGIPNARLFDNKISLYEIADQVFPKTGRLMLKEHFRCVPEIIQFSNDLSYGGQMVPLRVPFAHEKLEPPVMAIKVNDGFCTTGGTDFVNEPEADTIVDDIKELIYDETYDNQTIGVITLQGNKQASLIENKLREEIGEQEFVKRKIICGNAYTLQGDERDIIFLSLVVAPNRNFNSLTMKSYQQTYNVAASRARNQMRIYHSVELDDLKKTDFRYRLLSYCKNPSRVNDIVEDLEALCDSEFEKEVLRMIVAKGYKVRPQVKVGKYRIDLVIEGLRDRLAVEVDGERWHGPERWEEDMERQYSLERVGWKFWRIRGRQFYYNKTKSLEPLWERLEEMKIEKEFLQ